MATYLARPSQTTISIGHSYLPNSPSGFDTYTASRGYLRFNLAGYIEGSDQTFNGDISDGTLIRTDLVPAGGLPPDVGS